MLPTIKKLKSSGKDKNYKELKMDKLKISMWILLAGLASGTAQAIEIGEAAPQFTLANFKNAQATSLKQYAGKVVYLDFWASWCAPCRTSFPLLNKLHEKLKAQGVEVVAINLDDDKANAEKFLKEIPVSFTVLQDVGGSWSDKYGVESMPTSYILDKQGMVQMVHRGFASDDIKEIEAKVSQLLAKN